MAYDTSSPFGFTPRQRQPLTEDEIASVTQRVDPPGAKRSAASYMGVNRPAPAAQPSTPQAPVYQSNKMIQIPAGFERDRMSAVPGNWLSKQPSSSSYPALSSDSYAMSRFDDYQYAPGSGSARPATKQGMPKVKIDGPMPVSTPASLPRSPIAPMTSIGNPPPYMDTTQRVVDSAMERAKREFIGKYQNPANWSQNGMHSPVTGEPLYMANQARAGQASANRMVDSAVANNRSRMSYTDYANANGGARSAGIGSGVGPANIDAQRRAEAEYNQWRQSLPRIGDINDSRRASAASLYPGMSGNQALNQYEGDMNASTMEARRQQLMAREEMNPGLIDRIMQRREQQQANHDARLADRQRAYRFQNGMARPGEMMEYAMMRGAMVNPNAAMGAYGQGYRDLGYGDMMRDTTGMRANADMFGNMMSANASMYGNDVVRQNAMDARGLDREKLAYEREQARRKELLETNPHIAGMRAAMEARASGSGQDQIDAAYQSAFQANESARRDLGLQGTSGPAPQQGQQVINPVRQDSTVRAQQAMERQSVNSVADLKQRVLQMQVAGMRPEEIQRQLGNIPTNIMNQLQVEATYVEPHQTTWDNIWQPADWMTGDMTEDDRYQTALRNSSMQARGSHDEARRAMQALTGQAPAGRRRTEQQFWGGY